MLNVLRISLIGLLVLPHISCVAGSKLRADALQISKKIERTFSKKIIGNCMKMKNFRDRFLCVFFFLKKFSNIFEKYL